MFPSDKPDMPEEVHAEYDAAQQTACMISNWKYDGIASEEEIQKLKECNKIVESILAKYAPPPYFPFYPIYKKTNKPKMPEAQEQEYNEMTKRIRQIYYWEDTSGITPEEARERDELAKKQEALLESYAMPFPVACVCKPR